MKRKWLEIMGLAVSFPSTILVVAWGSMELVKKNIISHSLATFLILGVICGMLFLMVYYAYKRKN